MKVTALPEILVWLQQNNMSVELSYSPREGEKEMKVDKLMCTQQSDGVII